MDFISVYTAIKQHQQSVADDRYRSNPHARIHRVLAGSVDQFQRWQRDWSRDQCITVAQLRTGHSPLLAAYLYRIGWWDFATCPHYNGTDEMAEHLVLQCLAHDQAWWDLWPERKFNMDPRCLWDFLEQIGTVNPHPDRERERVQTSANTKSIFSIVFARWKHYI